MQSSKTTYYSKKACKNQAIYGFWNKVFNFVVPLMIVVDQFSARSGGLRRFLGVIVAFFRFPHPNCGLFAAFAEADCAHPRHYSRTSSLRAPSQSSPVLLFIWHLTVFLSGLRRVTFLVRRKVTKRAHQGGGFLSPRTKAQRSGFRSERRSNEAERMPAARRAQRSAVCDDAAVSPLDPPPL